MRVVFLGTPAFAVPTLERLAGAAGIEVTAVVCQPDRPVGRGATIEPPAVKRAAMTRDLPVYQPDRMRAPEAIAWLQAQRPDALAVVAYGQLLPESVFLLPRHGAINAHASLLPAYRGAAPIQWAIAQGAPTTGVTTMRINAGLDTGDMLLRRETPIGADETAIALSQRLSEIAAELMLDTLVGLEAGTITAQSQPPQGTLAPRLTRADGQIDWTSSAQQIHNRWRGFQPWPGIHTRFRSKQLTVVQCRPIEHSGGAPAGSFVTACAIPAIACGQGAVVLEQVKLEGRAAVSGADFVRGAHLTPGERL